MTKYKLGRSVDGDEGVLIASGPTRNFDVLLFAPDERPHLIGLHLVNRYVSDLGIEQFGCPLSRLGQEVHNGVRV